MRPPTLRAWDGAPHGAWGWGDRQEQDTGRNLEEHSHPGPRLWLSASVPGEEKEVLIQGTWHSRGWALLVTLGTWG